MFYKNSCCINSIYGSFCNCGSSLNKRVATTENWVVGVRWSLAYQLHRLPYINIHYVWINHAVQKNLEKHLQTVGSKVDSGKKAAEWRRNLQQQLIGSGLLQVFLSAPLCFLQFSWFPHQWRLWFGCFLPLTQPRKLGLKLFLIGDGNSVNISCNITDDTESGWWQKSTNSRLFSWNSFRIYLCPLKKIN